MGIEVVQDLVSRFSDHLSEYKSGAYGAQRAKPLVHCAAHRKQATSLQPLNARPIAVLFRLRDNESQVRRDCIDPFFSVKSQIFASIFGSFDVAICDLKQNAGGQRL